MKNLDTEKLKAAYSTPPESFHNAVTKALDSLEETKPLEFTRRRTVRLVAVACAIIALVGTFTVAAAATGLFGLIATRKGTYGLNVTVDSGSTSEYEFQNMNLKFGYLPDSYQNSSSSKNRFEYRKGDEYFNAWIQYIDNFDDDYLNVVETSETEYDGHKTLYMTIKEAENTDKYFYTSLKYFDRYNCLVHCNCSDFEELKKITEKIDLEPAPEDQKPADVLDDSDHYSYDGAIVDYDRDGLGFRDQFISDRVKEVKLGESIPLKTADHDRDTVNVTAKAISIKEQDNINGLEKKWFTDLGLETTFDMFFKADGTLIKEATTTVYEGYDEDHLGVAKDITDKRHFYVAEIELTAEDDIDDLHRVFDTDVFMFKDKNYYGYSTVEGERALSIYSTKNDEKLSLKKGEPVTIKLGFITENDVADMTYLSISAVDAMEADYQNYMVKVIE